MSTPEQPTNPESTPKPDAESVVASQGSAATGATWVLAIVAAIVAGAGSWFILEKLLEAYKPSFEARSGAFPTAEDAIKITRARIECGTLAFGATGGLVGLLLGLAGGISRKSI